jgi:hypothetical protein
MEEYWKSALYNATQNKIILITFLLIQYCFQQVGSAV